jgi:hypothetical protein
MPIREVAPSELLYHAAELIKQNANELWVAFSCEDGGIPPEDKDIENQIIDLVNTSILLIELIPQNAG